MHRTAAANSGLIDFTTQRPEEVRGLPPYTGKVNWDAVEMVLQTTRGSQLEKHLLRPRLKKQIKRHGIDSLQPWWRYHYCSARLALGDFSDYWGWECRGLQPGAGTDDLAARLFWEETWLPKWGGGNINRLLVIEEQGVGDNIFAFSIIPEALCRAREVVFECDPRLHGLFERSFPRLKCRPPTDFEDRRKEYGEIDAFILSMDLMRMFRRHVSHFPGKPYLKPDPARVAEMERFRGRIGVAWRARQGSVELDTLGLERPVSLQYKTEAALAEHPGIDLWEDIEGVAALCSVLEKVVCVPTTVHHIAGALGKRVEIIVPEEKSDEVVSSLRWDYPIGRLPWYANAEVFADASAWKRSCAQ